MWLNVLVNEAEITVNSTILWINCFPPNAVRIPRTYREEIATMLHEKLSHPAVSLGYSQVRLHLQTSIIHNLFIFLYLLYKHTQMSHVIDNNRELFLHCSLCGIVLNCWLYWVIIYFSLSTEFRQDPPIACWDILYIPYILAYKPTPFPIAENLAIISDPRISR